MARRALEWLFVLLGCVPACTCFSNGSVLYSCGSMLPGHPPYTPATLTPPYTVSTSSATYRPGGVITVTMETASTKSSPFQGFLLQARSPGPPERWPVGCFTNVNTSMINTLHCSGLENSSISHASPVQKTRVQVTWEAPNNSNYREVYFRASFVQTYSTFWVEVRSSVLKLEGNSANTAANLFWTRLVLLLMLSINY